MRRSTDRFLTTHTGSLPRPDDLLTMLLDGRRGPDFDAVARRAVADIVRRQADAGIDVVNDGEVAKTGFSTYVTERLTGFEPTTSPREPPVEMRLFPEFYGASEGPARTVTTIQIDACVGPITWRGDEPLQRDIANLRRALEGAAVEDVFITAASPGLVWYYQPNLYYDSHDDYVWAAADALRHEYEQIHAAGFVLQLDCPDLAGGWNRPEFGEGTVDEFRAVARMHVEALNHATQNIPPDRMRMHVCWGNFEAPHVRDVPLRSMLDILVAARPAGLSVEGGNPRHEHEWEIFSDVVLPDGKVLIPGVIDSTTNFVEHPQLVAQRILRYAEVLGRENVIAGCDCGFASLARSEVVHPTIAWAKLEALVEGARLASDTGWRHQGRTPVVAAATDEPSSTAPVVAASPDPATAPAAVSRGPAVVDWSGVALPGLGAGTAVLITGGTGAIGQRTAQVLVAMGCRVAIMGRAVERTTTVAAGLLAPERTLAVPGDTSVELDGRRVVEAVLDKWGRLDVLIQCAAVDDNGLTLDCITEETIDAVFATNVRGTLLMAKAAAEPMRRQGKGKIVNTSSIAGHRPWSKVTYGTTKAAILHLTTQLAVELGPSGINVNCVSPGLTPTALKPFDGPAGEAPGPAHPPPGATADRVPLRRRGVLDDYVGSILFLASDLADFVTGVDVPVEGGAILAR